MRPTGPAILRPSPSPPNAGPSGNGARMSGARRSKVTKPGRPPTARQRAFLGAVATLTRELGRAPSATEIGDRLGISRLGARRQLQDLEAKGLLLDVPRVVSSGQWALTPAGEKARQG